MAHTVRRRDHVLDAELPGHKGFTGLDVADVPDFSPTGGSLSGGIRGLRMALGLSLTIAAYAASLSMGEAAPAASAKPQALKVREHLSQNLYRGRQEKVDTLVLHTTEGSGASAEGWLTNPKSNGSAHYLVMEDGSIVRLVREEDSAWHTKGYNKRSIGIEIAGFHDRPLPDNEVEVAAELAYDVMSRQRIPLDRVKPHSELAPGWHFDPGPENYGKLMAAIRSRAALDGAPAAKTVEPQVAGKPPTAAEGKWLSDVFDRHFPRDFGRQVIISRCAEVGVDPVLAVLQINQASGFRNAVSAQEARGYMQVRQPTGEEELALSLWTLMGKVRAEAAQDAKPQDKAEGLAARQTLGAIVPNAPYKRINEAVSAYWDLAKAWKDGGTQAEESAARFREAIRPLYDPDNVTQNVYLGVGYLAKMSGRFYEIPDASERWKFALAAYVGGRPNVNDALQSARDKEGVSIHTPGQWQKWDVAKAHINEGKCNGGQIRAYVAGISDEYARYRAAFDKASK